MVYTLPAFVSTEAVFNGQRAFVKPPKIEGAKVHRPHAVVDFFKADVLIGENVTDVDPVRLPSGALRDDVGIVVISP